MELLFQGDKRRKGVDTIRAEREALLAEIETAAAAPLSVDESVARLLARLRVRAEEHQQRALVFSRPDIPAPDLPNIDVSFLYWLDPQAFEKQFRARLAPLLPKASASFASRPGTIAELQRRLRDMELREERGVLELQRQGLVIERRVDADVHILLAVWDEEPEKVAAA